MASTIESVRVTFTCDDCGDEWEEDFLSLDIDETPDHPDCTYEECDLCGCTCEGCECGAEACDDCGCGPDEDEDE